MSKWIKKGDKVLVISGNYKGQVGEVLRRVENRIVVQGVNVRKKHVKRRTQQATPSIIDIECPIHISNVSLCDSDNKAVKGHIRVHTNGKKELFYVDSAGKEVILREIKKSRRE
jgi:large subunit ribosomal protein L24